MKLDEFVAAVLEAVAPHISEGTITFEARLYIKDGGDLIVSDGGQQKVTFTVGVLPRPEEMQDAHS